MIVSIDTNILIQAAISDGFSRKVLMYVSEHSELVISKSVLLEYRNVVSREYIVNNYHPIEILNNINYRIINTPKQIDTKKFYIRDNKDYVVLYTLIDIVDILITNDKDFDDVEVNKPRIMTLKQFHEEFMQ